MIINCKPGGKTFFDRVGNVCILDAWVKTQGFQMHDGARRLISPKGQQDKQGLWMEFQADGRQVVPVDDESDEEVGGEEWTLLGGGDGGEQVNPEWAGDWIMTEGECHMSARVLMTQQDGGICMACQGASSLVAPTMKMRR